MKQIYVKDERKRVNGIMILDNKFIEDSFRRIKLINDTTDTDSTVAMAKVGN